MTVLFDNVDGCILTIQSIHSSIPFTTPSDALFGSLFVKFNDVSLEVFDAMLALFRHADFHPNAVTFKGPEDISEHIAVQRQRNARNRDSSRVNDQNEARPPIACHPQATNIIPSLLAEYIYSQRSPFYNAIEYDNSENRWGSIRDSLGKMSLVHRSWTDVAQRFLRRRMIIWSPTCLRSLLHSPMIGPWVRELSLVCTDESGESEIMFSTETPRLLAGVLHRCPNLTHLDLSAYEGQLPAGNPHDIIGQLACLKKLEHLWLRPYSWSREGNQEFWKLAKVLHELRFLKSINLQKWVYGGVKLSAGSDPIPSDAPEPSATIEALSLYHVDIVSSGILNWLLNPRNGIVKLELYLSDLTHDQRSENMEITRSLLTKTTTTNITKLRLVDCESITMLNFVLEFFPSLQLLSLLPEFNTKIVPLGSFVLPYSTTCSFHYHYFNYPSSDQDRLALEMLKAHPNIRRFLNTYILVTTPQPSTLFKKSIKYAARNDVEFKVTGVKAGGLPHIFDL